jgi:hypothetical protein
MAIAKKPLPISPISEARLDEFITGKGASTGEKGFEPSLLRRVDAAAKKRGVSRAACLQFVVRRALDAGEG